MGYAPQLVCSAEARSSEGSPVEYSSAEGDRPAQSTEDRADQCVIHHGGKKYVIRLTASAGKRTAPTRQLALKRVPTPRLGAPLPGPTAGQLRRGLPAAGSPYLPRAAGRGYPRRVAPDEADPTRTPLAEIPTPRRAHPRRRTAAKRKADELEQIENRPSGLVNRTVRLGSINITHWSARSFVEYS